MFFPSWSFVLVYLLKHVSGLNNGLALTPPMGWLAWERFRCNIDCKNDPENCISERLFMQMAQRIAEDGFKEVGYSYVIIDDCWMLNERDSKQRLQADPERFPHGIKYLADFVHSLGLKLGIYQDIGTKTCIGYTGSQGFEQIDVQTFADWEVDYFKLDGCYKEPKEFDVAYPMVGKFINQTGRKMLYSCSWPAYQVERRMNVDWYAIRDHCNLWRNFGDIQDSYVSITEIINWFAVNQDILTAIAGPGNFNDPDMLIIGNYGLSLGQAQSQMAIWAILAAPLMMSNDLRNLRPEFKEILVNKDIIAVNQDPLGIQGRQILAAMQGQGVEVWRRPILPVTQIGNETWASFAVVCWNRRVDGMPFPFVKNLAFFGLTHAEGYYVRDLFTKQNLGLLKPEDVLTFRIPPSGSVVMFKATLAVASDQEYKKREADLVRERLKKKPVDEIIGGQKYVHHVLPDYEIQHPPDGEKILYVSLKIIAVIVIVLVIFRIIGFRFGFGNMLRFFHRIFSHSRSVVSSGPGVFVGRNSYSV